MPIKFGNDSNLFDMSNPVGYTGSYPNIVENSSGVSSKWYEVSEVAKENAITVVFNPKENSSSAVFGYVASNDMETLELRAGIFNTASATIDEDNVNVLLSSSAHFKNMLKYKYVRFYYLNYNKINHAGVYLGNFPDQKFIPYSGGGSIASVKFGTTEISKIYRGSELVYQKKKRLPDEYYELEYIESTGTQRIDTGLTVLAGARWYSELDLEYTLVQSSSQVAIASSTAQGSWFGQNGNQYAITGGVDGRFNNVAANSRQIAYSTWGVAPQTTIGDLTRFFLDTVSTAYGKVTLFASPNDTYPYFSKMKLYGAKFYNADHKLIRDFIPAERKSDSVAGLYDIVTGAFFTNTGTGTFVH